MKPFAFDVTFRRDNLALDLALEIESGLTLLLGPNGAGKSTLLRLLTGLERPDNGNIRCGDRVLFDRHHEIEVPSSQRRIGLLFQHLALFPHLDVRANIGFGLRAAGVARAERRKQVDAIIERFALQSLEHQDVRALSGGERQKVALARTLAVRPEVLLLDEPTATLDQENRWRFRSWLGEILDEWRIPTLMVTHDPADAASFRKRIVVLEQGRIRQEGSLHQLLHAPATAFIADFAGVNYIPGAVVRSEGALAFKSKNGTYLLAPFEGCRPGPAFLTILPWEVAIYRRLPEGSPRNVITGTVGDAVILGDRVRITVVGREKLVAEISRRGYRALGEPETGESIYAAFKAREARIENC